MSSTLQSSVVMSQDITGTLTHLCNPEAVEPLLNGQFKLNGNGQSVKPRGVWISWNGGWEKWCRDEDYRPAGSVKLDVRLALGLEIFLVESTVSLISELQIFLREREHDPGVQEAISIERKVRPRVTPDARALLHSHFIARPFWVWIQERYDGAALTDEGQWRTRMGTFMYGWDCASLCVFDPRHVTFSRRQAA